MIANPWCGWCDFTLGNFKARLSYLTDVPIDLLDAFVDYYAKGKGVAYFDTEGTYLTLVLSQYTQDIFLIEDADELVLHTFPDIHINTLCDDLISDIENDFEKWCHFSTSDDEDDARLIQMYLSMLKELRREK